MPRLFSIFLALSASLAVIGPARAEVNVLTSIKELINDAAGNDLPHHLAAEREHFVRNLHHVNGGIGIHAFLNKQTPHYE